MNRGIVYIAIGKKYLEMSIASARSLNTQQSIAIITDTYLDCVLPENAWIIYVRNESNLSPIQFSAYLKTRLDQISPFDQTLFLDSDIRAVQDFKGIWDWLGNGISIAKAYNPIRADINYPSSEQNYTKHLMSVADSFVQYNSGVFLFSKTSEMKSFFNEWTNQWKLYRDCENMALTRVLVNSDTPICRLPNRYNEFYPYRNSDSCLVHYIGGFKNKLM